MKQKSKKKLLCYIVIILIFTNLYFIIRSEARIKTPDKIKITSPNDYKPFSYINESGKPDGVIIDFWKAWGRTNNIKLEFIMVPWSETLELIINGKADMHSGLFYNQERSKYMDFGSSYIDIMTGIYVHRDIKAWDISDIKEIGIGVTEKNYARNYLEKYYPDTKLHVYSNLDEVIEGVKQEEVQALSIDYHGTLSKVSKVYPELKDFVLLQTIYTQPLRVGVKKGNKDVLDFVNKGINKITYNDFRKAQSKWQYITIYLTRGKVILYSLVGSIFIITLLFINIFILRRRIKSGIVKLNESQENYKKLVELCPDGIFVQCKDKIVFANNSVSKILGKESIKEIVNKKFSSFVHEDHRGTVEKRMYMTEKLKRTTPLLEEKVIRNNGEIVDIEMISNSITYNGIPATLSIIRDISVRKEKEKERQRAFNEKIKYERLKTEFFANISHELKTPLNIILGTIQLMNKVSEEEKNMDQKFLKKYSKMMMQNCYRLIRIINNLIDLTKLDSGYLKMEFENYNIVEVVEDITLSVADYIESKDINIIFDTNTEDKIMACDVDKIERVLLNLLSNAVKFTDSGGSILVNVSDNDDSVKISIKDTGIGIPKEQQESIFERFRQAHPLLNREREGSGIGLSLVKSIIEAHDGNIYVKSEEGMGSEFIIHLPVKIIEKKKEEMIRVKDYTMDKVERINIEFSDIYSV